MTNRPMPTQNELEVLLYMYKWDRKGRKFFRLTELADELEMDKSNMKHLLDRLVRKKLVSRVERGIYCLAWGARKYIERKIIPRKKPSPETTCKRVKRITIKRTLEIIKKYKSSIETILSLYRTYNGSKDKEETGRQLVRRHLRELGVRDEYINVASREDVTKYVHFLLSNIYREIEKLGEEQ